MKSVSPEGSLKESLLPCSNKDGVSTFMNSCSMKSIVYISSTAATISVLLPQKKVDGMPVPTFFRGQQTLYHMFLISSLSAFMGAFSSLMIQHKHKPRVVRFCGIIAVTSMLSALVIALYAAAFSFFFRFFLW